ncbi:hypothetical protein M8998_03880 [Sphingobacterium sp. lm-10]|uniref:hypothetical protein n=1 Tax=Sphingobacterium sp. lm-10 TaxID=2944904 RepID=UPI00202182E7|nr:hypothetical protein [Sphingobacterium sp. lm-10]MCL7987078.1 hypothetical protein [Sphingobacterium sp. lm-10]
MKGIKYLRNSLFILFTGCAVCLLWFVLPAHLACRTRFEGESVTTIWGDTVSCHGESMDSISAYLQLMIGCLLVLVLLLLLCQLLLKKTV